jgi:hypothetical protein
VGRAPSTNVGYTWQQLSSKSNMTDRIHFITHQSKQILFVDLSDCAASQVEKIVRELPEVVTRRPRGSVLILVDFTGASFDGEALRTMEEAAVFDKPYIKKSAWIGAENFPHEFQRSLSSFSQREFPSFKTREEALTWLAED